MSGSFYWNGHKVRIREGESLAYALLKQGHPGLGFSKTGRRYGLFCGVGACQGCLVDVDGRGTVEACLTFPENGMQVRSLGDRNGPQLPANEGGDDV